MAAPSFSTTARDALSVVAAHLGTRDLVTARGTSCLLDSVIQKAPNYLTLQKLEWSTLLGSAMTEDFNRNEEMLRAFNVSTVELTASELEAWQAAWLSLHSPPHH